MDAFYDWVKNLAIFLLFVSILQNLLPKNNYEKYVKLFTGMLTIFLIIQPVSKILGLQNRVDGLFSLELYRQEMEEIKTDFAQVGQEYEEKLIGRYEEEILRQVTLLLEEEAVSVKKIDFYVCTDEEAKEYGSISKMDIYLGEEDGEFPDISIYQKIDEEKLAEKICNYYSLKREQVEIYG